VLSKPHVTVLVRQNVLLGPNTYLVESSLELIARVSKPNVMLLANASHRKIFVMN
jgi:hypothetical protein